MTEGPTCRPLPAQVNGKRLEEDLESKDQHFPRLDDDIGCKLSTRVAEDFKAQGGKESYGGIDVKRNGWNEVHSSCG